MRSRDVLLGMGAAVGAQDMIKRLVLLKFRRDVGKLNDGDYHGLLAAYDDQAVLHFTGGAHRWSGDWRGRAEIERFLQNFTAARIQGEIRELAITGPPWAATLWARFDDHADADDGTRIYENQTLLFVRTRWGRITDHQDFYADTRRIETLEQELNTRGVTPV